MQSQLRKERFWSVDGTFGVPMQNDMSETYDKKILLDSDDVTENEEDFNDKSNSEIENDAKNCQNKPKPLLEISLLKEKRTTSQEQKDNNKCYSKPRVVRYACNICEKTFLSPKVLKRHLETHAKGPKIKTYKFELCPFCGENFPQASLTIHMRRHTGEKPFKCDICDKAYVRSQDLKVHRRTHTGERPYVCSICGMAFSRRNKLARHNRTHTGERPYKCKQCDRSFAQRNDLNLHIRRHTGEKPYKCIECGERFISGTLLRRHQKTTMHETDEKPESDRFEKIRVSNPRRSYRNPISRFLKKDEDEKRA